MSLGKHLEEQSAHLRQLVKLLLREQQLLTRGQVDGELLTQLAREKQQHLAAVDKFERRRRTAQRQLGYGEDRAGAERAARDAGCLMIWQSIDHQAQEAARLNTQNGKMLQLRLEHNQRMLNFLREAAGSSLYGPDGQSRRNTGQVNSHA